MKTPNLQLPEVPVAIASASDEINEGFRTLDAIVQLAVLDKDLTSPPYNSIQGDRYIVAETAVGAWANWGKSVAFLAPDGWRRYVPRPGWRARVLDEEAWYLYSGTEWQPEAASGDESPLTTKGDIYTFDGSINARQPAGADGTLLSYDSTQPNGLRAIQPPTGAAASGARCYKNAAQSIPDSTLTALTWPVEDFDSDGYHDAGSPSRFTVALAGKYLVGTSIKWDANSSGTRAVYVVVNGVTATRLGGALNAASAGLAQDLSMVLNLVASDYVEFFVEQTSGGARDVVTSEQIVSAFIARIGNLTVPTQIRGATFTRPQGSIIVPVRDVDIYIPKKSSIKGVSISTKGGIGSCVVDIWKDTTANYPPTAADTICAAAKPAISAGIVMVDTTLTGWTTALNAGDWLTFHLETSLAFSSIFVTLQLEETT